MTQKIKVHLDTNNLYKKPEKNEVGMLRKRVENNLVEIDITEFAEKVTEKGVTFAISIYDGEGTARNNCTEFKLFVLDIDNESKEGILPLNEQAKLDEVYETFLKCRY